MRFILAAGLLATGEKVIAIAGTVWGSDTAMVMQAASTRQLRRLRVNEIICKPLNPLNVEELGGRIAWRDEKVGKES